MWPGRTAPAAPRLIRCAPPAPRWQCDDLGFPLASHGPAAAETLLATLYRLVWTANACPAPPAHPRDYLFGFITWAVMFAPLHGPPAELIAHVRCGGAAGTFDRSGRLRPAGSRNQLLTGVASQALHLAGAGVFCTTLNRDFEANLEHHSAAAQLLEAAQQQLEQLRRRHPDLPPLSAQQLLPTATATWRRRARCCWATAVQAARSGMRG